MPSTSLNGIDVHFETAGTGTPVILLHGWGTSGRVWDLQHLDLAADYQVITLDWRGCGRTSAGASGNTISQIADDLRDFIVTQELARPAVVGASMGGTFALEVGLRWPELIRGIVTVDAPYHVGAVEDTAPIKELVAALRAARVPTLHTMIHEWYEPQVGNSGYFDWAFSEVCQSSPFIDNLYLDHIGYDPRAQLRGAQVPIRLLHGELDPVIPLRYPHEAAEVLAQEEVHVLDSCGHFPHQLNPAVFNPALRSALASFHD